MSTGPGSHYLGGSKRRTPTHLFLDTEFTGTPQGFIFLSVALISDVGHAFYSEMPLPEARAVLARHPNRFVLEHVLPQFGVKPGEPWAELPARFAAWLTELGVPAAEVIYDFNLDYLFVEQLFERMAVQPAIRLHPTHVGYLAADPDGKTAAEACWTALKAVEGIGKHHALADVYALRVKFETVHGFRHDNQEEPPFPLGEPFELVAVVTAVIPLFEVVHADTSGGRTLSIGAETEGINWRDLREGQTLVCECIANPAVRVVRARLVALPTL